MGLPGGWRSPTVTTSGLTMSQPVTVTVVIPMRNAGAWMGETLEAVSRQTIRPSECVVVDDGSTDDSREVVAKSSKRLGLPITLVDGEGRGVAAARNAGIRAATGDVVAFLDADDLWQPSKLERQVQLMGRTDALLCTTGYAFHDDRTGRVFGAVAPPDADRAIDGWMALESDALALSSTAMLRRSVFEEVGGFDERFSLSADLEFVLRVRDHGRVAVVPEVLASYRLHPEQMHRNTDLLAEDAHRLFDERFGDRPSSVLEQRCRGNLDAHLGYCYLIERRPLKAIRRFASVVRTRPMSLVQIPLAARRRRAVRRAGARNLVLEDPPGG